QERRHAALVTTAVSDAPALDPAAERELMIQQLLDQAFVIDNSGLRDYVFRALRAGQKVSSRHLPVDNARDLLAMAHVIEVGAVNNLSSRYQFSVEPTGNTTASEYFYQQDEFMITLTAAPAAETPHA